MKPKKHLIARAHANGSIDRLNQLLSASHILLCEANGLLEEAADLMEKNGLLLGELKQLHNRFTGAADRYFSELPPWWTPNRRRWTCSTTWTDSTNISAAGQRFPRTGNRKLLTTRHAPRWNAVPTGNRRRFNPVKPPL